MITTPLIAALAAAVILTGILITITGATKTVPAPRRPPKVHRRPLIRLSTTQKVLAAVAALAGVAIAITSGWLIAPLLLPVAVIGLPILLSTGDAPATIRRLEGLEDWSRHLSGRLGVGAGLEQAIIGSLATTKPVIEPEVRMLVARLRANWTLERALTAFADDLHDPVGDQVVASLKLAARPRSGNSGLSDVLTDIADSVAISVSHRRVVDTEQAKVRTTARLVTLITVIVLVGLTMAGTWMQPYTTPTGQVLFTVLIGAYISCLLWMRRVAQVTPPPRLITETGGGKP